MDLLIIIDLLILCTSVS